MSVDLVPSPPSTVPTLIVRKLNDLGANPIIADLNGICELFDIVQEERLVSDEEVQELKNVEKKTLENQNEYKKETENMSEKLKFSIWYCLLFPLPLFLSVVIYGFIPKFIYVPGLVLLLNCWPFKLVAVVILFRLYGLNLGFEFGTPKPDHQPEMLEDDDDWQDSMTSTELQYRQEDIVERWDQLKCERKEYLFSSFWPLITIVINFAYSYLWAEFINDLFTNKESISFLSLSSSSEPTSIFLSVGYIFSCSMTLLFSAQFLVELEKRYREKIDL